MLFLFCFSSFAPSPPFVRRIEKANRWVRSLDSLMQVQAWLLRPRGSAKSPPLLPQAIPEAGRLSPVWAASEVALGRVPWRADFTVMNFFSLGRTVSAQAWGSQDPKTFDSYWEWDVCYEFPAHSLFSKFPGFMGFILPNTEGCTPNFLFKSRL